MYLTGFTPSSVRTIGQKTFDLTSNSNYAYLYIFLLANHVFLEIFNDHWLLIIIVIHSIHHYIICKSFVNVDFILVPYYMIHDIIY